MSAKKNTLQNEIEKIWPKAKKNISRINKDIAKLMKKSEENFVDFYSRTKKRTYEIINKAKREELYYELGKNVTPYLTSEQLKNRNILKIYSQIQQLNKKLRSKR